MDLPLPVPPRTKLHYYMFLKKVSLLLTVFMSWDSFLEVGGIILRVSGWALHFFGVGFILILDMVEYRI